MPTNGLWTNCGCSTLYTDAWGNPINGPSGDGAATGDPCATNWGLLAFIGVAAIVGMSLAHSGRK